MYTIRRLKHLPHHRRIGHPRGPSQIFVSRRQLSTQTHSVKPIVVTTPIFYVNGEPHIGHLYSTVIADAIARWHRIQGKRTLLVTGTDEHGLKVQETAEKKGVAPQQWCDKVSAQFRNLFDRANIQYDDFIRTTEPRHKAAVEAMWKKLYSKGDIYLGQFEGWYSVPDETFLTPLQVVDGVDSSGKPCKVSVESGHPVQWVVEPNYLFRLTKYISSVEKWLLTDNPVVPRVHQNKLISDLKAGTRDLSVSRLAEKIKWGIPVPNDPSHVIYVWLDALTNYLTICGYPDRPTSGEESWWPADYHVLGKDIVKFHAVYWPAFLMAADMPLPKKLIVHAHWTMNKEKMSKSKGNIVDPHKLIDQYGVDPVRYFLLKEGGLADDGDFSHQQIFNRVTSDLADNFGNLVARVTSASLNPDNVWPEPLDLTVEEKEFLGQLRKLPDKVNKHFIDADFRNGIEMIFEVLRETNRLVQHNKPWELLPKKAKKGQPPPTIPSEVIEKNLRRLRSIIYVSLEAIRVSALLLQPIMPTTMKVLLDFLRIPNEHRNPLEYRSGYNYAEQTKSEAPFSSRQPLILFQKPEPPQTQQNNTP